MYGETMPGWFWAFYYSILFITMAAAVYSIIKKQLMIPSVILILSVLSLPIVSLISSIERDTSVNELEHFISQLQQGAVWTLFSLAGYLYLAVWWFLFFLKKRKNVQFSS